MFEEVPSCNRNVSRRLNSEIMHSEDRPQSLDDPIIDSNDAINHSSIQVINLKKFQPISAITYC